MSSYRDAYFPSKFAKPSDLNGQPVEVEIAGTADEQFEGETVPKCVLIFTSKLKPLILNMTNYDAVAAIAGDDMRKWPGTIIKVYPTTVPFRGQTKPCLRIGPPTLSKAVKPAAPIPSNGNTDMDDTIPF
jgi:hypothetical protein